MWLEADADVILRRVKRRADRPLLKTADPAGTIAALIEERYPVYRAADITIASRDVPHDKIVDECVDALHSICAAPIGRRGANPKRNPMTAPLTHSAAITVEVALGDRAYDIVIGRDVLGSLGERIAALRPGARTAIVTDRTVATHWLQAAEASLTGAGIAHSRIVVGEGEGSKTYAGLETGQRGADRREDRAQRSGRRARRRRGRRSRRLCGGDPAPRRRFRAGADLAAGAGRFLGRRQDRHQLAARQESARRVPPAGAGGGRHCGARHAVAARSSAPATPRWRNTALLGDEAFFAWLEANHAEIVCRRPRPRTCDRHLAAAPRRRSWRATSARPASARCSISATPSATRWKPRPASPTGCSTARASPSAWCWRRNSPPNSA